MLILSLPDDEIDLQEANTFMDSTPPDVIASYEAHPVSGFVWREFAIQGGPRLQAVTKQRRTMPL